MCSAFPDTDRCFGSLGSFFAQRFREGSFQLNPPFVDDLVVLMVKRLEESLEEAEAQKKALTFVVVVCAAWPRHRAALDEANAGSRSGRAALGLLNSGLAS